MLDYWRVIWKRRWMITGLCVVAVFTAGVVSFLMPRIYESTATVLQSLESGGGGGGMGGLLAASGMGAAAQNLGIVLPGVPATPTDLFVAMLKSRTMIDDVIKQFDLMDLYGSKTMGLTRKRLQGATKIFVTKEKVIQITVESTSPQLAADIANYYVQNLDRLNRTLNSSKARSNRKFIEQRLMETRANLTKEEDEMKQFQLANKTVGVEAQASALMLAAYQIQTQIMAQEVQLQVLSSYLSPDNPELARQRAMLSELRKQLYVLESGKDGKGMLPGDHLHPAMITVPGLALEYTRAMRELKLQETLYMMLVSQLEQAKLAEARDTPTVQMLDQAIPAETRSKPQTMLNITIAGFAALLVGVFLAFFLDYLAQSRARQQSLLNSES